MESFPCSGCGCCCKRIDKLLNSLQFFSEEDQEILNFPYKHKNGICENLNEQNECSIYENRPLICNVDKFAEYYNKEKKSFYLNTIEVCNEIMDEDNIDEKFRIKI